MISNTVTSLRILLLVPLYYFLTATFPQAGWVALGVFLLAGLTDIVDGRLARGLGEVSPAGAMLDLLADRLLTLTTLAGLLASGAISGLAVVAAAVLIGRDLIVATLCEALPGKLDIKVSALEKVKITLQFLAFGLLIAPEFFAVAQGLGQHQIGLWCLALSACLTVATLTDYVTRCVRAFRAN